MRTPQTENAPGYTATAEAALGVVVRSAGNSPQRHSAVEGARRLHLPGQLTVSDTFEPPSAALSRAESLGHQSASSRLATDMFDREFETLAGLFSSQTLDETQPSGVG